MRPLHAALFALLFSVISATASAQIVNVQAFAGKLATPGFSGQAALSADWLSGNSNLLAGNAGATIFAKHDAWFSFLTGSAAYGLKGSKGKVDDIPFQEKTFVHVRVRRDLSFNGLSLEGLAQHEFDLYRRLKTRAVTGIGLRWDGDVATGFHVAFGATYLAQFEQLLKPSGSDPIDLYTEHRLSTYFAGVLETAPGTSLSLTLYAQPLFADAQDLRSLIDAAIQVAIGKSLALRVNWAMGFDTRPPVGVLGYDGASKVTFIASF